MKQKSTRTTITLPNKTYRELKELADKECRPLTHTVEVLLKFYKQNNKLN